MPAEAERGGEGNVKIGMLRGQRRIVEVTVGVRLRQVDRRGAMPSHRASTEATASAPPAAPSMWPVMDLVELMVILRAVFAERFFDR